MHCDTTECSQPDPKYTKLYGTNDLFYIRKKIGIVAQKRFSKHIKSNTMSGPYFDDNSKCFLKSYEQLDLIMLNNYYLSLTCNNIVLYL